MSAVPVLNCIVNAAYEEFDVKILTAVVTTISTMSYASGALAHGGHGAGTFSGIAHWLIEPMHGIPVFVSLVVTGIAVRAVLGKIQ